MTSAVEQSNAWLRCISLTSEVGSYLGSAPLMRRVLSFQGLKQCGLLCSEYGDIVQSNVSEDMNDD